MTWRAVSNDLRVLLRPTAPEDNALLPQGTFVLEVPFTLTSSERIDLIDLDRSLPWLSRIRLSLRGNGALRFEHVQAERRVQAVMRFPVPGYGAVMRITLAWAAPHRVGVLMLQDLRSGRSRIEIIEDPLPWTMSEADAICAGRDAHTHAVSCRALSDQIEPSFVAGGFAVGTQLQTAQGVRPIETVCAGDLVETAAHGMQPVSHVLRYRVPNAGQFRPICLAAPFFGLSSDLLVAPDHRLLVSGAEAEYLFGAEQVLIKARHLQRVAAPLPQDQPPVCDYVHLLFPSHVCVSACGAWAESLYTGEPAQRSAAHALSPLADMPKTTLPCHTHPAGQELQGYDAAYLVSSICA